MLEKVEKQIAELIDEINYPKVTELFTKLSGGKRLRARLILTIAQNVEKAVLLGAIVELIHAASLLHDDVIDEASMRRGTPSVNATHGSKIAIMLGDVLYSKAFNALSIFDSRIVQAISNSVTQLSIGEMMDVEMSSTLNLDRNQYLQMLYLKTATLIEACAYSAAVLAGKDYEAHAKYGKNLGLAFQLVDDILDITADEAVLGKPSLNDFSEGKTTLPYIDLYECLDANDQNKLIRLHGIQASEEDKLWIRRQMDRHGIIEKAYRNAQDLCNEGAKAVENDPILCAIIDSVMKRSH